MGCFPIPKNKSKVAAAFQQADQQQHSKNYGQKLEQLLSSNKPVVLPDPDDLSGEQSQGSGPLPSSGGIRGGGGKQQQSQPTSGRTGASKSNTKTASVDDPPSKFINHNSRVESAPVNLCPVCGCREDSNHQCQPVASHHASSQSRYSYSAPLCTRPSTLDGANSPSGGSPTAAAPVISHSTPLHGMAPSSGLRDATNRSTSQQGMDKKFSKAVIEKKARSFAGKPTRLPVPQAGAAHPLPLPHPSELDDPAGHAIAAAGMTAGLTSNAGLFACVPPSPGRRRDALGNSNTGFRMPGGGVSGEALPLPPPTLPSHSRIPVKAFPYSELAHALMPDSFLCDGPYGRAYRATIDENCDSDHKTKKEVIVVCPFVKALQGLAEWLAEVNWLAHLQDPHLCRLLGYCVEDVPCLGTRRLLVYEYVNNGSLDMYLTGRDGCRQLDWSTRMRVALDVAQGLMYLHDKAPFQVICKDLSSPSIHLDKDLRAKLCGFGLVRSGPEGDHGVATNGPYAAPESAQSGVVTIKSNAWGFGVVLLELITGRRHMDPHFPSGQQNLIQFTKPFLRDEGKLFLILDPELNGKYSGRGALRVANLAFQCLMKEASLRPNMSEAVDVLKGVQTDEETLTVDLKKSRSLTQSVGSPVVYSRSSSDHFIQRSYNSASLTSSPAVDSKQRDREFLKMMAIVPGSSSPSYGESRLSIDLKYPRTYFNDRDAQRLPPPMFQQQASEFVSNTLEGERDSQKLPNTQGVGAAETTPTTSPSALYGELRSSGLRKVASYGAMSSGVSSFEYRRPGSPVRARAGSPVHARAGSPVHARAGDAKKLQPRNESKFREFERMSRLHMPEASVQKNENKRQHRESIKLHAQQSTGNGHSSDIKFHATTDSPRQSAGEPSLSSAPAAGGDLKVKTADESVHSEVLSPPNAAAGEGKKRQPEERKSSAVFQSPYFLSTAELKASIDSRRSGEFSRSDLLPTRSELRLSGELRPARSDLRLSGELRRSDFRRDLRLSGELRRIDPKAIAELRRSDLRSTSLDSYKNELRLSGEFKRADHRPKGENKRRSDETKAQALEARLLSGGVPNGMEAVQAVPMPAPVQITVPEAVEHSSTVSSRDQHGSSAQGQLRTAGGDQQDNFLETSESEQTLLPTMPIPTPPSLSRDESGETPNQDAELLPKASPSTGASARSSCAPPLTFDPPVTREELCVVR